MEMVETDGEGGEEKWFGEKGERTCTGVNEKGKKDMQEIIRNEDEKLYRTI